MRDDLAYTTYTMQVTFLMKYIKYITLEGDVAGFERLVHHYSGPK